MIVPTRIKWLTQDEFHSYREALDLPAYLAFVRRGINADVPVGAWGMEEDGTVVMEATTENFKQCLWVEDQ